jgi:hypothetical protein
LKVFKNYIAYKRYVSISIAVSASYKAPTILYIYAVKPGKSLGAVMEERKHLRKRYKSWGGDRGKKTST